MAKRVFNNGKSIRVPFSNDMDQNGAEYNMDKLSHLLDEKISLDQLRQELKKDDMKNSRKRPIVDELKYTKHYHPNETVEVNHLFNLDQSYGLKNNGLEYAKKHFSHRKLKNTESKNKDGIILETSAGSVQLNNKIAEKFAHGKKRLKITNKYVTDDKLLNFSDNEQMTYGFANNTQSEKSISEQSNSFTIGNQPDTISIPIRNRSTNKKARTVGFFNCSQDNLTNSNLKKQYPYGEVAMPSNGKTVVEGNYDSYIDWDKTICSKFGDNHIYDYVLDSDNKEDNLIVPEKYYQTNQNVPRTAYEWEYQAANGDKRYQENLPNANIVSNENGRNALTFNDEQNLLKPFIMKEGNNMYDNMYKMNNYIPDETAISFNLSTSLPNISISESANMQNISENMAFNTEKVPYEIIKTINQEQVIPSINFNEGDNMNKVQTFQDDDEFRPVGGNGVYYSPRMHKPTIFNQKAVHQAAVEQFGPNPANTSTNIESNIAPAPNAIAEAKEHAGMTASIALSLKLRDLKVKVTEFAKNVNKVDHSIYDAMNDTIFRMLHNVAKIKRRTHHKTTIYELDADCEFMRDLIKTAVQLQYLSPKKGLYNAIVALNDEIGAILGGFLRNMKNYENKKK